MIWLAGAAGSSAYAQPEKPAPTFRLISVVGSYGDVKYQPTRTAKPLLVSLNTGLSSPLPSPANGEIELYREVPPPADAPPGTPPVRQTLLTATLPANATEAIVVALPREPQNKTTAFISHVVVPPPEYLPGTILVANFSPFPLAAVAIKNTLHEVATGAVELITLTPGHTSLKVAVQVKQDGRWVFTGEDAWRLSPRHRGYLFIFPYLPDPNYPASPNPPPALVRISFDLIREAAAPANR